MAISSLPIQQSGLNEKAHPILLQSGMTKHIFQHMDVPVLLERGQHEIGKTTHLQIAETNVKY